MITSASPRDFLSREIKDASRWARSSSIIRKAPGPRRRRMHRALHHESTSPEHPRRGSRPEQSLRVMHTAALSRCSEIENVEGHGVRRALSRELLRSARGRCFQGFDPMEPTPWPLVPLPMSATAAFES
jgi:hypothetical protein